MYSSRHPDEDSDWTEQRKLRVRQYSLDANRLLKVLNEYLHCLIDGKTFYQLSIQILDDNSGLRNEFLDEYIDLESYAASHMSNNGAKRSREDLLLRSLAEHLAQELTTILSTS